ncbi:MAG: PipX family protein [Verrucomicrobia bacterium]|nr:PipX family protein [Leptolyngbya sp. ES-bin-22]
MSNENYLNHPNFGLLFRVCLIDTARELFTTLYAQRLFFLVANGDEGLEFESITRTDARILVENRMRMMRRQGQQHDYNQLQVVYKQTFQ